MSDFFAVQPLPAPGSPRTAGEHYLNGSNNYYESMTRYLIDGSTQFTSGVMRLAAVNLPAGFTATTISYIAGTGITLGTGVNAWAALYDTAGNLMAQSTTTATPVAVSFSNVTFTLASSQAVTTSGTYYVGVMYSQTGGALPFFQKHTVVTGIVGGGGALTGQKALNALHATTGLTTTAPATTGTLSTATADASCPYFVVS